MPLITFRYTGDKTPITAAIDIWEVLPRITAEALSCEECGRLKSEDIMLEVDTASPDDVNVKDVCIRVYAHDYPARRENLDAACRQISEAVKERLPEGVSWYVWVWLMPTAYSSDTEPL